MHILIIPSWYPKTPEDVSGSFFREQAQALSKYGCKVGVISLQLRTRGWYSILRGSFDIEYDDDQGVATYRKQGVRWSSIILSWIWKNSIVNLFEYYVKKQGVPDIIHVHSMLYAGVAAKVISENYHIPFIVSEHSTAFARGKISEKEKQLVTQVAESSYKRYAVSKPFANLLDKFIEIKHSPWEVIPNIVHERFFSNCYFRSRESTFTFINIALLTQKKGVDFLIRSFSRVLAIEPYLKLKIGGDGIERSRLEALSRKLGIAENIEFLGMLNREQVLQEIVKSDAFVLSSHYETFGVVVIEALALGKPVIATCCGGPEDIVRKQDGILVPIKDEQAMVDAMLSIYKNRGKYNATEIRNACYERYSEKAVTQKLIQEYQKIIDSKIE